MSEITRTVLKKYWGYDSFRPLQEEIVDAVVDGRDTLALLPTGGGKSVCFQVPAMAMDGVCVVVTPLIALMKDQVAHLVERNIPAASIYSGMHADEMSRVYNRAVFGDLKFLYVSPERLQTNQFVEAIRRMKVCLLAVDESHCISQWGYDFRPPYLKIAEIRPYIPSTPVLALTATATSKVVEDIQFRLGFKKRNVFQSSFERKNVIYNVCHEPDKYGVLFHRIKGMENGSAIVYVRNRKRTQMISEWLNGVGISSTYYHAGLDGKERDKRQEAWMRGGVKAIVATNAFGMGIDKPDVRLVVHMDLPDSIEAYFQEAGRAGRDGQRSDALLLVSDADVQKLKDGLKQSYPDFERVKLIYNALGNYYDLPVGSGKDCSFPMEMEIFARRYGFSPIEVFHTLKILEKEGYILLSESFSEPSKVMIKADRDDLYGFQVNNPKYGDVIKYMLRSMSGVLSDFVPFNEEKMARVIGLSVDELVSQLKQLEDYNFLSYAPRNDLPSILFLSEFVGISHFSLTKENYYDRREDARQRMQAVIDFVNNDVECRSVQLLRYFNEKTSKTCGKCDVCLSKQSATKDVVQIETKITNDLNNGPMTIREVLKNNSDRSEDEILEAIRWLVDNGVLSIDKDERLYKK